MEVEKHVSFFLKGSVGITNFRQLCKPEQRLWPSTAGPLRGEHNVVVVVVSFHLEASTAFIDMRVFELGYKRMMK